VTTIHLVRHAVHDLVAHTLVGRSPAVALSAAGRRQAQSLAAHFAAKETACVQSSPQPRAAQTAQPIAAAHALRVEIAPDLDELDMGAWTGRTFADLQGDPLWHRWNAERGAARPPGGESMSELQHRALRHLQRGQTDHPDGAIVMVTHAELIRAVLLHCLGRPLDDYSRLTVDPASVTTIGLRPDNHHVIAVNRCVEEVVAA
jgi:broad specificity phosphatase PhoE